MKFDLTKFTSFKKCSVIPDSVGVLAIYFALFLNVGLLDYTFAQVIECGHPAVPINSRVSLSDDKRLVNSTASYKCDDGYELFGSSSLTCSPSGHWTGELPFCGTNVALRRPTNQSSTIRGGQPSNANDGELTTVHDGKRCTETQKEVSPWWQVDLLRPYPIRIVRITTRGCCGHQPLQDLEIRVGNSTDLQKNPLCAWFPGTLEEGITKTFSCARTLVGQNVFVQLVGVEGSLSLCEVEIFTTDEFSTDRCASEKAASAEISSFDRNCYEFNIDKGASFLDARAKCQASGGDLVHGFRGITNTFLLGELERRKDKLKTLLVWIGAQKEPGITARTWKWVDGEVVTKPSWGKDQPNNYNGEQNCVVLDGGRGWLWNDVGCKLDYLHWICQHNPATCGSPDKNVNTTFVGPVNAKLGSTISYACPEGNMLAGSVSRTCKEGFWTGMAPTCQYVDCGKLDIIEHGTVSLENTRTTHGAIAKYACHENYTLIGESRRVCDDSGRWNGTEPQCLFDWCSEPPQISGGIVTVSGRRTGSIATYSCEPGFILFGSNELKCGLGGEWSGKAPTCKYVDCGSPANIDNGHFTLINGTTTHGSVAEYTCGDDYWLEAGSMRRQVCMRDGKWSGDTPSCELITCPEPEVPKGGYVVGYDLNVHSAIEFHCEPGHLMVGPTSLKCTRQGEWDNMSPQCQYIDCGRITAIPYGSITYLNETTYLGSEVIYSCSRNYRLVGHPRRTCLDSKVWSDSPPKCEEIRCPEPVLPAHSILSVTGNDRLYGRTLIKTADSASSVATYKIGALVKYRCERGYKVEGEPLSTCEDSGSWSGSVPECIYVDCGTPESIPSGGFALASNATYYGTAVLYECEENYRLEGHARRLCLENGTWSGGLPTCREVLCKEPESMGGLQVKVSSYQIGSVAQYSCPRGQEMMGNSTRACTKRGTWSGHIPTCTPVDCSHPGSIDNGRVIIMNQTTTYNSAVEYHCVPQFQRIGPYLRKCMEDGLWSGDEPRCEKTISAVSEAQTLGYMISIGAGIVLFLLILLGIIYARLRKATPVKNTENVQAAVRKEEQTAAVMSYASLSDTSDSRGDNIYENVAENPYDNPYDTGSPYYTEPSGGSQAASTVTINGVAVR